MQIQYYPDMSAGRICPAFSVEDLLHQTASVLKYMSPLTHYNKQLSVVNFLSDLFTNVNIRNESLKWLQMVNSAKMHKREEQWIIGLCVFLTQLPLKYASIDVALNQLVAKLDKMEDDCNCGLPVALVRSSSSRSPRRRSSSPRRRSLSRSLSRTRPMPVPGKPIAGAPAGMRTSGRGRTDTRTGGSFPANKRESGDRTRPERPSIMSRPSNAQGGPVGGVQRVISPLDVCAVVGTFGELDLQAALSRPVEH